MTTNPFSWRTYHELLNGHRLGRMNFAGAPKMALAMMTMIIKFGESIGTISSAILSFLPCFRNGL